MSAQPASYIINLISARMVSKTKLTSSERESVENSTSDGYAIFPANASASKTCVRLLMPLSKNAGTCQRTASIILGNAASRHERHPAGDCFDSRLGPQ